MRSRAGYGLGIAEAVRENEEYVSLHAGSMYSLTLQNTTAVDTAVTITVAGNFVGVFDVEANSIVTIDRMFTFHAAQDGGGGTVITASFASSPAEQKPSSYSRGETGLASLRKKRLDEATGIAAVKPTVITLRVVSLFSY